MGSEWPWRRDIQGYLTQAGNVPSTFKSGKVTFVVQVGDDNDNKQTLVGVVAPDGKETITRRVGDNEIALDEPNIDGGVAGDIILGIPPKLRATVIVKFIYKDTDEDDDTAEYRFEGKLGVIKLPLPG